MSENIKIGFAGLTHLGINYLAASASKKFQVVGFDRSKTLVSNLKKNKLHVSEPKLSYTINKYIKYVNFTNNLKTLSNCNIIYISSDVPTSDDGSSDISQVQKLISDINKYISKKTVLVVLCQVSPGFTRNLNLVTKKLYYQVETLVFGEAIKRASSPERIIIGSRKSKDEIDKNLSVYLDSFNCPLIQMNYESAELAKISINMYLVSSVTVTNILSEICEKIGADWDEIKPALKLDKRIGKHAYISSGLGISGGNLERDLKSISKLGEETNSNIKVIDNFIEYSDYTKNWLWKTFSKIDIVQKNSNLVIGILGMAYKENTNSIKNSPSIKLISKIKNFNIKTHDPEAIVNLPRKIERKKTVHDCIIGTDILIICTPWKQYYDITIDDLKKKMRGKTIIDPYRIIVGKISRHDNFICYSLGRKTLKIT